MNGSHGKKLKSMPTVNSKFIDRIDEMDETELSIFLTNVEVEQVFNNQTIKDKIIAKIKENSGILSTAYLWRFKEDDEITSELLKKIIPTERVNAIVVTDLSKEHNEVVTNQILEMIDKLSDEEVVRYAIYFSDRENEVFERVINNRIKNLSDEDIKFLFYIYDKIDQPEKETLIEDLVIERGLTQEYDGIPEVSITEEEEENYIRRFSIYRSLVLLVNRKFPYFSQMKVGIVDEDNKEESNANVLKAYEDNTKTIKNYSKFLDYFRLLSNSKDKELYGTIMEVDKRDKIVVDGNTDENILKYYDFIAMYLGNRILNMDDEKFLNKLYVLGSDESVFLNTAMVRMQEKGMKIPGLHVGVKGEDGSMSQNETTVKGELDDDIEL